MIKDLKEFLTSRTHAEWQELIRSAIKNFRTLINENPEAGTVGGVIFGILFVLFFKIFILLLVVGMLAAYVIYVVAPKE